MLAKLTMLILLPAGVDADTARELVGRWQSEPIKAESGKVMTVEFRQLKDKPTEEELQRHLLSFGPVVVVDQVEPTKGYMVTAVIESVKDFGQGGSKRLLVEYSLQKDQYPLSIKVGELSARFARVKEDGPKPGEGKAAFEYLRVTSQEMNAGTVAGLKHTTTGRTQNERIQNVLNYLGGAGWDAVFAGETLVCKRRAGIQERWEYMAWEINPKQITVFDDAVKEAGRVGWELTAVHDEWRTVIFKRPLAAPKDLEPKKERPKREDFPSRPIIK